MRKQFLLGIIIVIAIYACGCTGYESLNNKSAIVRSSELKVSSDEEVSECTSADNGIYAYKGKDYCIIEVDGGDTSGVREANVAVDIGYGDRDYWGLTNEYGQLAYVLADEIILQDDALEPVNENGRYYNEEAFVPGTEASNYDQGHVIADSLGGVSNAYNITPQDSTLNRYGTQAYMEQAIREAGNGSCINFMATITYPNTQTQVPSSYKFEYTLNGNPVIDEFENVNPESEDTCAVAGTQTENDTTELATVDTNGDGKVTIKEAKAAGYAMPITKEQWLYQYMDDRDGDGKVGE